MPDIDRSRTRTVNGIVREEWDYINVTYTRWLDDIEQESRPLTADEIANDDERNEDVDLEVDGFRVHVAEAIIRYLLMRLEANAILTSGEVQQIKNQAKLTVAKKRP